MKTVHARLALMTFLVLAVAVIGVQRPAPAQQAEPGAPVEPGGRSVAADEPRLIFEREAFNYAASGRRDPFRPLTSRDGIGPVYEALTLRMIIYSEVRDQSLVVVADAANRTHRLRRGDVLGNARLVEIEPARAIFSVEDLGVRRQEVLVMRRNQQEGVR